MEPVCPIKCLKVQVQFEKSYCGCLRLETLHLLVKARMETTAVRLVRDRIKTTGDVTKT
ncbi:unnamed protein product [Rhodiola kirilowii]